ncbi:MAG: hypothetical protein LCH84_07410 [Gemmatimonadetes bacterium]|nr:hypothetical protein [Gemmatimonadota bacterium]
MSRVPAPAAPSPTRRLLVAALLLGGAVLWLYGGLLTAPALSWDDGEHIFDNPLIVQGDVAPFWRGPRFGLYIPLVSSAWAALYAVGDGAVWPFRAFNLLLHVVNVLLVARLVQTMLHTSHSSDEPHAAPVTGVAVLMGATLFALHPLQVATVAWISGGRDLAATAWALGALLLVLRRAPSGVPAMPATTRATWRPGMREALATLAFAAALLCKPQVAAVPLALGVWWWCTDRARLRAALPMLLVWCLLVVGAAWLTRGAQQAPPAVSMGARLFVALDALGFHTRSLLWPATLATDYGRTPQALLAHPQWAAPGLVVLGVFGTMLWRARAPRTVGVAAALCWATLLLPVLGLVPFEYQRISTVADHYTYLPMAAAALLVAWLAQRVLAPRGGEPSTSESRTGEPPTGATRTTTPWGAAALAWGVLVVVCSGFTAARLTVWRAGDAVFYRAMLDANPASYSARTNLAVLLCEEGGVGEALALLDGITADAAHDAPVLANRAFCLLRADRAEAVLALTPAVRDSAMQRALAGNTRAAAVFVNSVAEALHRRGDEVAAFAWLCQAQRLHPGDATTAANLATARRILGGDGPPVTCPDGLTWVQLAESVVP